MSSNSFATVKLKMKTLPAVFSVAIHFTDRHSNRSFLLLRIVDLLVDAVDVVDVSVSEFVRSFLLLRIVDLLVDAVDVVDASVSAFVLSPPGEHLAFLGIVLMLRQILVAVEEAFSGPISIQTKNPMFGVL